LSDCDSACVESWTSWAALCNAAFVGVPAVTLVLTLVSEDCQVENAWQTLPAHASVDAAPPAPEAAVVVVPLPPPPHAEAASTSPATAAAPSIRKPIGVRMQMMGTRRTAGHQEGRTSSWVGCALRLG
jgi:hypothetical protein